MIWFNCLGKDTSGCIDCTGTGIIQERYLECHCNNQARADDGFELDSSREGSGMESRYGSVLKTQRTRMAEKSNGVWGRNNKDRDSSSKNCGLSPWEDEVTTEWDGKDSEEAEVERLEIKFGFGCVHLGMPIHFPRGRIKGALDLSVWSSGERVGF